MTDASAPLLEVRALSAGYGGSFVLSGVSFNLAEGEVLALIGHNGAGKTTLVKAIAGLHRPYSGEVVLRGDALPPGNPLAARRQGVGIALQGHRVFPNLTAAENLRMGGVVLSNKKEIQAAVERVVELFPELKSFLSRPAGTLSGGERQILALATVLMHLPQVLLLDEPSLGLAPDLIERVLERAGSLAQSLGIGVVIIEHKVRQVLAIADRACVLRRGSIAYIGSSVQLTSPDRLRSLYL